MKKLLGALIGMLIFGTVFSSELDSVLTVKYSPFFKDLINQKAPIQPLRSTEFKFTLPQHKWLASRRFQFFKSENDFYIHFNGSGLLYKLQTPYDSILTFKRIDDTENLNYNIEAYLFTHQKEIYNIGGYGYWRTNGTLRKYNRKDQEWDAEPIDQEIHLPYANQLGTGGILSWFNPKTQFLYIPYQSIINSGLKIDNQGDYNEKHAYRLDLNTKVWKKLGKTGSDYYEMLTKTKWIIPTDFGQLLCFNQKAYLVNFEENEISVNETPSFAQSLERINYDHLAYYHNQNIYYLNGKTHHYDSVKVPLASFEKTDLRVWKKNNTSFIFGIIPILIITAATAARKRKANKEKEVEKIQPTQTEITTSAEPFPSNNPGPITAKIRFSETEKQLLKLLLNKSKQNSTTTIAEINYVLGIKDKNIGLQKKVRSDVMNSINEKFGYVNAGNLPLIGNIRSVSDKRFFEYFIEKTNITLLESMLQAEAD